MDIASSLSAWILNQLEFMPHKALTEGFSSAERLIGNLIGERETAEIRALLEHPVTDAADQRATVFLPGLMGSLLASVSGIGALLWINPTVLLDGHINLLDLDDEGRADRAPEVRITAIGIEKMTYLPMIVALARNTRLYEFPYDWRRHIEVSARQLHEALLRWSSGDPERRFTLVGHSMGGLVARAYTILYPVEAERLVEGVVMVGTPLQGVAASALIFTGDTIPSQVVTHLNADNDVIGFASRMPASYQLLPPPPELFRGARPYPLNWDAYDATTWGLPCVRQRHLDAARRYHQRMAQSGAEVPFYQIAGCHRRTVVDVWRAETAHREDDAPPPTIVYQERGKDSGDELVPLWSSHLPGVQTYYVQEAHQQLPSNRQVLDGVLELVYGRTPALPETLPEALPTRPRVPPGGLLAQVAALRQRILDGDLRQRDIADISFAR